MLTPLTQKTRSHSLDGWRIVLSGTLYRGFADGDAFTVTPNAPDQAVVNIGADGSAAVAHVRNDVARVVLRLQSTNPLNDELSAAFKAQRTAGEVVHSMALTDSGGTTSYVAAQAWIVGPPVVGVGSQVGVREWSIEGNFEWNVGGSAR